MNGFEVVFVEYPDRPGLRAEIYCQSEQWAEIYENKGVIYLSIFFDTKNEYKAFPYQEMIKFLEDAKITLLIKRNTHRALDKMTSVDPKAYNQEAEKVLEKIMNCSSKKTIRGNLYRYGKVIDYIAQGVGGARFSEAGEFIGFIEV